ncbi:DUF2290 domain-containing protein [Microbacterium arborescens]|uniref:DUF2290 domain-containing protein n=1 Tax=Microbacterium arborescens TaxID=33883 RepID=UPI0025A08D82|nr:DUF2290 domain-containing protein [Microbacterium arborescens]WJM17155.1 DUF2290 domain-containing protein [Microbacterium arborescens]
MTVDGDTVAWRSPTPLERFVDFADYPTVRTYRRWAVAGEYSALLNDGALLQMRYTVANGAVTSHRLAFVPCPYRVDPDLLLTESLSDIIELHTAGPHDDVTMQSTIRFDYDPMASAPGHPAAHLTINAASCRIACEAPMTPAQFIRFVYQHFYPDLWLAHPALWAALPANDHLSTVTDDERHEPHVAWRRAV